MPTNTESDVKFNNWYNMYFDRHVISNKLKFSFFPRKCCISNKSLWFKMAYKSTAMFTGPGDPIHEDRWYDKNEFILKQLKE